MDADRVVQRVEGVPHMRAKQGRELYRFLRSRERRSVLELGTSHGVSTCYMAAAAEEVGGHVTTIDRRGCENLDPNVWTLLDDLQLSHLVTTIVAERSMTWELGRMLRDEPARRFDFCFFDAGHSWDVTGFAFLLVDRLLAPGGWILFDDLTWTHAASPSVDAAQLPEEEAAAAQVGMVFDVLVAGHDRYGELSRTNSDRWGWARKVPN